MIKMQTAADKIKAKQEALAQSRLERGAVVDIQALVAGVHKRGGRPNTLTREQESEMMYQRMSMRATSGGMCCVLVYLLMFVPYLLYNFRDEASTITVLVSAGLCIAAALGGLYYNYLQAERTRQLGPPPCAPAG
jgi:hypothetical protein